MFGHVSFTIIMTIHHVLDTFHNVQYVDYMFIHVAITLDFSAIYVFNN